ncbi:hypothetical protein A4H97_19505 [Niastella yeongjuensis]|uniref:Peptidase S74 domain-containing protein n=1 Tax=Niastella yeongjuensis TaxID=354355 RepID=A0A1V9DYG1_9BACT|nr:hypothetical protein [Niastella yeongjuensis]OQP38892.1 hypothetical protein A4H97_19505 [Niastella yeongjuensis]SEO28760.1 hypothetical protein SAMN05660816_02500 [Niastella yeongjuensis]
MFKTVVVTLLGTFLFHTVSLAQLYVKGTGVGIGTSSPTEKLHVSGKALIESNDGNILTFKSSTASAPQMLSFYRNGIQNLWMGLDQGTDFQIENKTAGANIQLKANGGRVYIQSSYDNDNIGGTLMLRHPGKTNEGQNMDWAIYNMKDGYGNGLSFWGYGTNVNWGRVMTLGDNGNVAIGSIVPGDTYKLQVDGTVNAKGYKVNDTTISWSDYVFDPTYKLRTLPDVESYLIQNHHLPEVPSAETVKKEGVSLVENQALLLKKIEELTLYAIEQNKKILALEEKVKLLEEKGK